MKILSNLKYLRSRYYSALELLNEYRYPSPFHLVSKQFFKAHKKFGSKDRRAIADICFNYFRLGISLQSYSLKEGLLISLFALEIDDTYDWYKLCDELEIDVDQSKDKLTDIKSIIGTPISFYKNGYLMEEFIHYNDPMNYQFRPKNWAKDHMSLETGKLGLPGVKELKINQKLTPFVQVQDLSSQFLCSNVSIEDHDKIWDLCCGAGGKSLNLCSLKKGEFYLSNIRPTILKNAEYRMKMMHYKAHYAEMDMSITREFINFKNKNVDSPFFDTIIADVPCSGSGTWFRTPEHFINFDYESIDDFTSRQRAIIESAFPFLKIGGVFHYMTCSVFEDENSGIKEWVMDNFSVSLQQEIMFDGIRHRSDGMYLASFMKLN